MSIPLYFAMSWEASQTHSAAHKAQLGFGFQKGGTLFVPEHSIANAPIVINDAIVPQCSLDKNTIRRLADLCKRGCFFDFERPVSDWSIRIFKELQPCLDENLFLAVPQAYAGFAHYAAAIVSVPELPNNWTQFCKKQQEAYNKWVWEVIPYQKTVPMPAGKIKAGTIKNANCCCRQTKDKLLYYDTMETIFSKLEIAQYYGCIAGIGLSMELDCVKKTS